MRVAVEVLGEMISVQQAALVALAAVGLATALGLEWLELLTQAAEEEAEAMMELDGRAVLVALAL